jgi:hypothetical protein
MWFRRMMLLAAALALGAVPALADSVDGKPMLRADRQPPASVRGSPSILFEDHGFGLAPLDTCASDDGATRSCGTEGRF